MADVVTVPGGASTKRVLAAAMTLILTVLSAVVIAAPAADAHGAPTRPGSRTYLCRVDGTHASGDIQPYNPACDAAVQLGGKQPLWDWFGVLRGDGAGRTRGYIPDGQLCSGGEPKYAGYDLARADWPYTRLTAGDEMVMRYNAWAAHPGEIRLYVTRDGYDPTKPLGWDDLEPEPFSVYRQDQPNGQDEVNQTPDYQWPVTLPQKSGPHIIYSIWERSDSQETFYGCSDVRFDGGSGEVIGIGPGATVVGAPSGQTANTMADTGPATTVAPGGAIPAETPAAAGQTESADGVEPPMAGNAPEASEAATGATAQPADESSTAGAGPSSSPAAGSDGTGGATSLASAEADTTTSDAGAVAVASAPARSTRRQPPPRPRPARGSGWPASSPSASSASPSAVRSPSPSRPPAATGS